MEVERLEVLLNEDVGRWQARLADINQELSGKQDIDQAQS